MCGIVGILHLDNTSPDRGVLQRMNDAIRHRGPDDEGLWLWGPVGLAMRRLAIIDIVSGHQPLCNEDETVWIAFNGEIYNFPELRGQLEAKGHHFRTHSDTETIVHAYEEWGEECPSHLRGMFAFAIYDTKDGTLFLARDRVGKKPLVYTRAGNTFVFASEFQALLQHPVVPRRPNLAAFDAYLSTTVIPAPMTGYEGIHKLRPGHTLTIRAGKVSTRRYWSLDYSKKLVITEADAAAELLERLRESVRMRMISEVPLGAFLSGGIDSSAIVALMAGLSDKPVRTFSIGFEEGDYSELPHARRLAEKYGTDHTEVIVKADAVAILPKLVRHYGEPYADSSAIPTYYVSEVTRRSVTVALNGDGGDEVFGGYERYYAMKLAEAAPAALRRIGRRAARMMPSSQNFRSRGARLKRLLEAAALPRPQRYLRWISAFTPQQKQRLYTQEFRGAVDFPVALHPVETTFCESGNLNIVDSCMLNDTLNYLPDDLLAKVDIASMSNSLEARSPFLDHPLMEWSAQLPPELKVHGRTTKHILRRAISELVPAENMERPKMGFGVPVGRWFHGALKPMLHDTVLSTRALERGYFKPDAVRTLVTEHLDEREDHTYRLWSLLMLELWHREFIDGN